MSTKSPTSTPKQTWQPIRRFERPAPYSPPVEHRTPASNACARHAVEIASSPGGIDGRQRHN
jgi:hypothetical protein